jgi:hypothetical protein
MTSEAARASRANGQRSHGPTTIAGGLWWTETERSAGQNSGARGARTISAERLGSWKRVTGLGSFCAIKQSWSG